MLSFMVRRHPMEALSHHYIDRAAEMVGGGEGGGCGHVNRLRIMAGVRKSAATTLCVTAVLRHADKDDAARRVPLCLLHMRLSLIQGSFFHVPKGLAAHYLTAVSTL